MGFSFQRLKNWLGVENLNNTDLNAEFNNIISKAGADTLSSANSTNGSAPTVAAMQTTSNPGGVGTEVLAATLQADVQQLRYQLNAIIGGSQWYSVPAINLSQVNSDVNQAFTFPASRIISGRLASANNQPMFLVPDGTAATVNLKATSTNFQAYFNASLQTFSADIAATGLSTAPGSNNTCLVNDSTLSGAAATKTQGEYGSSISIGTIGSGITALSGSFAAFKTSTEYFIAQVENGTSYATPTGNMGLSTTGDTTNTSSLIKNVATTVGLYNGMTITGTGIPGATTILSFTANSITLSANATASNSGVTFTILGTKLTGLSSVSGIAVGQTVSGTGVVAASTVTAISYDPVNGNTVTLSTAGSAIGAGATYTFAWYRLKNAFRGVGFDSSDAWLARVALSNGNTITLMKLTWVFATYNSTTAGVGISYNKPTVSDIQPTSPAIGDYWYDVTNSTWKSYNGTSFVSTIAVFIGVCIQDTTGTKAARSADFFKIFSSVNTIEPSYMDSADVQAQSLSSKVSVYGSQYYFQNTLPTWNTVNNLDSGVSLAATTKYYCYVTDLGDVKISNVAASTRKFDLLGAYHPAKPWRCVADFTTDGGSNVVDTSVSIVGYHEQTLPNQFITTSQMVSSAYDGTNLRGGIVSGTNIVQNANLTGLAVQSNGKNVTVSNTNATNGYAIVRGIVNADGSIYNGEGFTVAHPGNGTYTITFTTAFGDPPAVCVTSITGSTINSEIFPGTAPTTTTVGFLFQTVAASVATDVIFNFIAIGQRAQ